MSARYYDSGAFITDGRLTCHYDDLAASLATLSELFTQSRVDRDACIALCGTNSLPLALTILGLLRNGIGLALCAPGQPVPPFCRYAADTTGPAPDGVHRGGPLPVARCLRLEANPAWRPADVSYRGRFYARTSGTTADAKLVLFSHDRLWANARNCVERFQLGPGDRVAIPVPVAHMYGLAAALLPAVLAGSAVDIQPDGQMPRYLERESAFDPTVAFLTPTLCYALARVRHGARPYRLTVAAGDRTPPDIFAGYEQAHGCLLSLYGSTELGAVAAGSPDDSFELRCHSTGRPMPGVRIHSDEAAPEGAGRLRLQHPAGGLGYADECGEVNRTEERLLDGCFHSEDVGQVGDDGYLRIVGRADRMAKRDGLLVAFSEVESALLKNPSVEAAAVFADGVTPRGAGLTAVCVANGCDPRQVRDDSRKHLPAYAVPDRIVLVEEMPRLPSGKADPRALRQLALDRPRPGAPGDPA